MRINHFAFLTVFLVILILGVHTPAVKSAENKTTAGDVKREAGETLETLKSYTAQQRDEAMAEAQKMLKNLDNNIETLQKDINSNWQEMSQAAREQSRETLKALQKKRREAAEWFGGMRHSSTEAWEEVKEGYAKSYQRLEQAFEEAKDKFQDQ